MKLEAIYEKDINRTVNPAVSASDFSDKTVKTEIEEYRKRKITIIDHTVLKQIKATYNFKNKEDKKWALDGVELPPETIVKNNIYWSGIHYR